MLKVADHPELQAAALLFNTADGPVQQEMKVAARAELDAVWTPALAAQASTRLQNAVIVDGARSLVHEYGFTMTAANGPPLRNGLDPGTQWQGSEFGMTPKQVSVRIRGRERKQTVGRQFGPRRRKGKVAYPAARETGPRIVAAWVHGLVRGLARRNPNLETTS